MKNEVNDLSQKEKRIWRREDEPVRKLLFVGLDKSNELGYLILYGKQNMSRNRNDYTYLLDESVNYTHYAIFKGKRGHLPSIPEVEFNVNYYNDEVSLVYIGNDCRVEEFYKLKNPININYYNEISYKECIEKLKLTNESFQDFKIIENINELLKIKEEYKNYFNTICEMLFSLNRYIRKKRLNELLELNLPLSFYRDLIQIGSTEFISGLFLEAAKRKMTFLLEEADKLPLLRPFAEKNYFNGMIRCINIYKNAIDDRKKEERVKEIYKDLPEMDLNLIHISGRDIKKDEIISSKNYFEYAQYGMLREKYYDWSYRKEISPIRYKAGIYNDGKKLDIIMVKNTIQEAEAYGLADVIGKVAYYIDSPRIYYYLQCNNSMNICNYFRRYIRRILDNYAKVDEEKFITAMKTLLTSYTKEDYIYNYAYGENSFEANYFIKMYLYRKVYNIKFIKGRYEFCPEIWDRHINEVLEIVLASKIYEIQKACYYILENVSEEELYSKLTQEQLIELSNSCYEPLASLGLKLLKKFLSNLKQISEKSLFMFLQSNNKLLYEVAIDYLNEKEHKFSVDFWINVFFLKNKEQIFDLWKENILSFTEKEYIVFIKKVIENRKEFHDNIITEDEQDVLQLSLEIIQNMTSNGKEKLFNLLKDGILLKDMPTFMKEFLKSMLFSYSKKDMEKLFRDWNFNNESLSFLQEDECVMYLLNAVKNNTTPTSFEISDIIEKGTSKMINLLVDIIQENKYMLSVNKEVFLMLLECPIISLNNIAKEVFENADTENKKELLIIILNSPVEHVYRFGLDKLYKRKVPEELLLKLLEHPAKEVKNYVAKKTEKLLDNLGDGNIELFLYYVKALLYLPNKISKAKSKVYEVIPKFVEKYPSEREKIESILLDIGGSNNKIDAERALVSLAAIKNNL